MSMVLVWVGVKRLLERQWSMRKRSPLEYIVLATLSCVLAATLKYPNRAFLTRPRPDLKALGRDAPGYPLIGNLPDFIKHREDPLQMLHDTFREHGDVVSLTMPVFGRMIIVNRPEFMEHILKTNFDNYIKGALVRWNLADILGRGIFVSDGAAWRFHRKTASNIFTTKLYRSLVQDTFKSSAHDLGRLTFGLEFNALSQPGSNEFGDAFDYLTTAAEQRLHNPLWFITDRLIPSRNRKDRQSKETLNKYAAMALAKRRAETEEEKESRPRDLLDHFIGYMNDDGTVLSDRDLRDVFVNFMVAGRDTTAQGLTWQFYSLMANPRIMTNIVKEVDHVLQGSEDNIKYEVLMHDMPYTKAVLHETLRLHPPVPKNLKQAVNDDVLPDGTRVYKGEFVGFSNWCMGRNQAVWGVDAELFVPERWLVPDPDKKSLFGKFKAESQFKFITFNAGPRLCLGQTFAILEAMVTTCILLQRYTFTLQPNHPIPTVKGSVTLPMRKPLMAVVARREKVNAPLDFLSMAEGEQ
ncbi:hypothetical protein BGZ98_006956 [Dissophora globulifera]|nr:hypothetical protein BGZ98_006956 [Dissophora globulifera]